MRISENRMRQIIREELEELGGSGAAEALRRIKRICDDALMNKSLVMKGLRLNVVESIVNELNKMMGEELAILSMHRGIVPPPHTDAVDALEWISDFCGSHMNDAEGDLGFRAMCVRMISRALSGVEPFRVHVKEKGLPRPHLGGPLGARDPDEER